MKTWGSNKLNQHTSTDLYVDFWEYLGNIKIIRHLHIHNDEIDPKIMKLHIKSIKKWLKICLTFIILIKNYTETFFRVYLKSSNNISKMTNVTKSTGYFPPPSYNSTPLVLSYSQYITAHHTTTTTNTTLSTTPRLTDMNKQI